MKRKIALFSTILCLAAVLAMFAQASAMDVTLAWDPNSEADLAGYKIHWGTSAGGPYPNKAEVPLAGLADRTKPQFTVKNLDGNVRHYFVATAYDTEGLESGYSNEVNADGITGIAPSAPSGLKPVEIVIVRPDGTRVKITVP